MAVHSPFLTRRRLLLGAAAGPLLAACGGGHGPYRMPAETARQAAVMLASPTIDYKHDWSMMAVQADMVRELVAGQRVLYLVNGDADRQAFTAALQARGMPLSVIDRQVLFRTVDHADVWVRDIGGLYLSDGSERPQVVDFAFDGYGYNAFAGPATVAAYDLDGELAVRVAQSFGWELVRSPLIAEGGNLHVNGRGTVIATELGLLGRNPGWTRAQAEAELMRVLGVRHVIWVPRSLASDAHTVLQTPYQFGEGWVYNIGVNHIDELVAWVDARTLLLPQVSAQDLAHAQAVGDPTAQINHAVLEDMAGILAASTDQDGRPLQVLRVPEPGPLLVDLTPADPVWHYLADLDHHPTVRLQGAGRFAAGEPVRLMLAASYMNYVVANGCVLVPRYHKPGRDPALAVKDEVFRATIAQCYPGRRVVQIDADALNVAGGGMHCITQQIPQGVQL